MDEVVGTISQIAVGIFGRRQHSMQNDWRFYMAQKKNYLLLNITLQNYSRKDGDAKSHCLL